MQHHSLEHLPPSRRFVVGPALDEELPALVRLAEGHLPRLKAGEPAIWRVHKASKSILAVRTHTRLAGFFALLFLTAEGLARLAADSFNVAAPDDTFLLRQGERPAALYVWAMCLPGSAVGALGNIMQWLRHPAYAGCDMFARPVTPAGKRIMIKTGFQLLTQSSGTAPLWVYRRSNLPFLLREGDSYGAQSAKPRSLPTRIGSVFPQQPTNESPNSPNTG